MHLLTEYSIGPDWEYETTHSQADAMYDEPVEGTGVASPSDPGAEEAEADTAQLPKNIAPNY